MKIDPCLKKYDPSRYVVYQMLDYLGSIQNLKLFQKFSDDIYFFRTEPFIDSLYNFAHLLKEDISEDDLTEIKKFFEKYSFRIKLPENEKTKEFLLSKGLRFKETSASMINNITTCNYEDISDKNIQILPANNSKVLNDYKQIFSEAFNCDLETTNRKFGFEDKIILDPENFHINAFVLYENNVFASAGAYYAFDNFSIENIGTRKEFRGKGYANKIMQHLMKEAQKLNYSEVCLVASEAGLEVYKKMGFKVIAKTNTFVKD